MQEGIIGVFGIVWVVAVLVLGVLTIMIPVSVYLTQKYTLACFKELKLVNKRLNTVSESLLYLAEVEANRLQDKPPPRIDDAT